MKEYSSQVSDLTKGINPTTIQTRNTAFMTDVYNAKVSKYGIEPAPSISSLIDMPGVVWPLPQIVGTSTKNYVVSANTLYEIEPVTRRLISLVTGLSGSRQWDIADFGLYQVWTNGIGMLVRGETGVFTGYTVPAGGYTPYTVCNYKGQLICGGLGEARKDWISWSQIGSVDLSKLLSNTYGLDPLDMKNEAGCRKMPFSGQILKVFPLESGVMVYGEGGIAVIIPVKNPAPTYGMQELGNIRCTGAVGGCIDRHIFLDEDGYLWSVDNKYKVEKFGYNRVFAGKDAIISYDDSTENFYIATPLDTYLLPLHTESKNMANTTSGGLSRLDKVITSILSVEKVNIAPYTQKSNTYAEIVSDIIDFNMRGTKTITAIELATDSEDMYVAVDYRFRGSDAFRTSTYKQVYRNGMVFPIVSGDEFRIRVRGVDASDFNITYMNIRWKLADKRTVRGMYASADKQTG